MPPIDRLSVHPSVLAALREDARAAASLEPDAAPSPIAAWLIGVSLGAETRAVGVVRVTPGRAPSEDLAATTALLPGGISVVGAAAALLARSASSSPSSSSLSSSLADAASAVAEAARAAAGGASSSGNIAAATDPKSGATVWIRGGEPVEVAAAAEDEEEEKADAAAAANLLSPAVAALSAPRRVDPWLAERFSAVRCGPLRVSGGTAGAAACLAELCGDGDDPGDAAFVVAAVESTDAGGSSSRGASRRPLLLAGDGPAPLSGSLLCPLLATPLASPPPPPAASLRSGGGSQGPPPAPTAVFEPSFSSSFGSRELVLDALALYPKTATAGEAAAALRSALSRQLRAAMAAATASSTAAASSNPSSSRSTSPYLRACPFLLPGLPVIVTPLMLVPRKKKTKAKKKGEATSPCSPSPPPSSSSSSPPSSPEAASAAARDSLGRALRLPPGLPMLRPSAAFDFDDAGKSKKKENRREKLLDVHLSLPSFSKSSKSSSALFKPPLPRTPSLSFGCVAGSYRYHHYGQDSKDDRGWGCAYRSLQTLWSWFAENHFLAPDTAGGENDEDGERESRRRRRRPTTPPSHAEIQRALVSVGDKPASFIGSTQWIGALEISFALDELAGVQSKVVAVARGSEMSSSAAAGALVAHFRTQGTPVMIGGGVLAYTCLGCCFDPASGEASFLILDPHYCGVSDDRGASDPAAAAAAAAAAVVKGGWVAWKKPGDSAAAGGPLFVDDAFYNLLCPQRPETV